MTQDELREYCLALPFVTEEEKWKNDLCFCVAGKMFAIMSIDPSIPYPISFKVTQEQYLTLLEREGVLPAPYLARNHWVSLVSLNSLNEIELKTFVRGSYQMIYDKLSKKIKLTLT